MRRLLTAAALCLCAAAAPASAADGTVTVERAWARPTTTQAKAGAAFVTLSNPGTADRRLVGAESPVSERAELHTHVMDGGVARMRPVESIALPAGGTVRLAPGGDHIMLMGLKRPLRVGERFAVTLRLDGGQAVEAEVEVLAPGTEPRADGGAGHHAGHHDGHGGH